MAEKPAKYKPRNGQEIDVVLELRLNRSPRCPSHVLFDVVLRDRKGGAILKISKAVNPKMLDTVTDVLLIDPTTNKHYKRYKIIGLLGDD